MDLIPYLAAQLIARLLAALPARVALAVGRGVGALLFSVVRLRRSVVLANLRRVYGGRHSEEEVRAIARGCYRHWGMVAVEMARMTIRGWEGAGIRCDMEERHARRLGEQMRDGKGAIWVLPHLGNFEVAGAAATRQIPIEAHAVMKPPHSPRFRELLIRTRERLGMRLHLTSDSVYVRLYRLLRSGKIVALLPDQNAKRQGLRVRFLGHEARFFPGYALLHIDIGAPIFVGAALRSQDDPTRFTQTSVEVPIPARTGDRDADIRAVMQAVADVMTEYVERAPEQYFWFHRLWGEEALAGDDEE